MLGVGGSMSGSCDLDLGSGKGTGQECNYSIFSPLPPSVCDAPRIGAFLVQVLFCFALLFPPFNKFPVFSRVREG